MDTPSPSWSNQWPPAATSGRVAVDDPHLHEAILPPWDLIISPLKRGPYGYRMQYVAAREFVFYRGTFDNAVRFRGHSPRDMMTAMVPLGVAGRFTYWKRPMPEAGIPCTLPADAEATFDAGNSHFMVLVHLSMLRRSWPGDRVAEWERWARSGLAPAPGPSIATFAEWLQEVLDAADRRPEMLHNHSVVRWLGEELLQRLADSVSPSPTAVIAPIVSSRRRAVSRVLEYLNVAGNAFPTVPELCTVAGVSQRTLEYAFRDTFDLTPLAFLRLKRMHAARRHLMSSDPTQTTVTRTAHDVGFWHLARFASTYRGLFGELPSETLAHRYRKMSTPLLIERELS